MDLVIVTATTNAAKAQGCLDSWGDVPLVIVSNGGGAVTLNRPERRVEVVSRTEYLGTVPAFNLGVEAALDMDAEIIACLHDDFEIHDPDWVKKTVTHFRRHPACGLAGFGGAIGLGAPNIYQIPYDPMQLARVGFRSNLVDAEVHGIRSLLPERVACLDGFSQIGRKEFWSARGRTYREGVCPTCKSQGFVQSARANMCGFCDGQDNSEVQPNLYQQLEDLGVTHHLYDGLLGCYAARLGWETWYLPIAGKHYGGRTAVGDQGYQHWALSTIPGGDHGFWQQAHQHGYREFRDVLPLRV